LLRKRIIQYKGQRTKPSTEGVSELCEKAMSAERLAARAWQWTRSRNRYLLRKRFPEKRAADLSGEKRVRDEIVELDGIAERDCEYVSSRQCPVFHALNRAR